MSDEFALTVFIFCSCLAVLLAIGFYYCFRGFADDYKSETPKEQPDEL